MADKIKEVLVEWISNFIKNKDMIIGTLQDLEKNKEGYDLVAYHSDKTEFIIVEPFIKNWESVYSRITKEKNTSLVLFNSNDNFNIIINKWKILAEFPKLTVYFVNMFSTLDQKWIIKPYLHNRIADDSSLKTGLNSMFIMVEPITEQQVQKIYKE